MPQFKTPVELNAANPSRMVIVGDNSIYESTDQGNTIVEIGAGQGPNAGFQDAVASGTTGNPDALYVGIDDEVLVWATSGGALTSSVTYPGGKVLDVVMDPNDFQNAFVIDSNQVFHTTDAGSTWSDITGNIMSIAGDFLWTVEFIPGLAGALAVEGDLGVFTSQLNALGIWTEVGTNLPNAVVYDVDYDAQDDVLVAGTMGRGAWKLTSASNLAMPSDAVLGDMDLDGDVDFDDIDDFVSALVDPQGYEMTFGLPPSVQGDIDGDGDHDFDDTDEFVTILKA